MDHTAEPRKELTWSRKWHYVKEGEYSESGRYLVAFCGAYLEHEDSAITYPQHLKDIKAGRRKSTGMCKICAKIAGADEINKSAVSSAVVDSIVNSGIVSEISEAQVDALLDSLAKSGFKVVEA